MQGLLTSMGYLLALFMYLSLMKITDLIFPFWSKSKVNIYDEEKRKNTRIIYGNYKDLLPIQVNFVDWEKL